MREKFLIPMTTRNNRIWFLNLEKIESVGLEEDEASGDNIYLIKIYVGGATDASYIMKFESEEGRKAYFNKYIKKYIIEPDEIL